MNGRGSRAVRESVPRLPGLGKEATRGEWATPSVKGDASYTGVREWDPATVRHYVRCASRAWLCAEQLGNRGPRVAGHKCTLLKRPFHKVMLILNMKEKQHSLI